MNQITVGTDEVGRGCLAGSVVAAAVILPEGNFPWIEEIKDSKLLTAKKRAYLSDKILEHSISSIREVSVELIDQMNILYASLYAMKLSVEDVYFISPAEKKPNLLLLDGNHTIPVVDGWLSVPVEQRAIVDGDNLHKSIGAASIIAKVYRDNLMVELDKVYPNYGFAGHKGYGSSKHRQAIMEFGPTPEHRKTFRGVREYL